MKSGDNPASARDRIIIALDFPVATEAVACAHDLSAEVSWFKIGLQLYTAEGPEIVREVAKTSVNVFLDLKLHDIPNTVGKAVAAAAMLKARMLTIHLSGGARMVEAAVAACPPEMVLLGVTVLTSSDEAMLRETGVAGSVEEQTLRLAKVGVNAGITGLIASPQEVQRLRAELGDEVTIVTPGVRPAWAAADDQKRFTTPRQAIENGADYLVIGRPVTSHPQPREAVRKILDEIGRCH